MCLGLPVGFFLYSLPLSLYWLLSASSINKIQPYIINKIIIIKHNRYCYHCWIQLPRGHFSWGQGQWVRNWLGGQEGWECTCSFWKPHHEREGLTTKDYEKPVIPKEAWAERSLKAWRKLVGGFAFQRRQRRGDRKISPPYTDIPHCPWRLGLNIDEICLWQYRKLEKACGLPSVFPTKISYW